MSIPCSPSHFAHACATPQGDAVDHMNDDKVGFMNEFVVRFVVEEGCTRLQQVTPLHHVLEQMELARPQIDRPVATLGSSIDEIKLQ